MNASEGAKDDNYWWKNNIYISYNSIDKGNPEVIITTDACQSGWDATLGKKEK